MKRYSNPLRYCYVELDMTRRVNVKHMVYSEIQGCTLEVVDGASLVPARESVMHSGTGP